MDVLVPDHDREPALDSTPFYRPKPDGDLNPAGEAGWYLQREREKRGLSLDQICEATGIHPYHVEAIEMGDLTRLPQRLEALEMVGIYGEYMGFEPEPLVTHYAAFLPRPQGAQGKVHPADPGPLSSAKILKFGKMPPFPRFSIKSFPGGAGGVIGSCFAAILLFAAASWVLQPVPGTQPGEETAQTEPLDQAGDPMPTATTGQSDTDVAVREEPMPEDAGAEAKVEDETPSAGKEPTGEEDGLSGIGAFIEDGFQKGSETQPQKAAPQAKKPAAADKEAAATPPAADPGSRLVLRAKAPVWVRIEDAQGNVVMTQMLRGGDTYSVPDRQGLVVIARDGGLLSYIIDGKERGILGTPGQILVGQPLDIPTLEKRG